MSGSDTTVGPVAAAAVSVSAPVQPEADARARLEAAGLTGKEARAMLNRLSRALGGVGALERELDALKGLQGERYVQAVRGALSRAVHGTASRPLDLGRDFVLQPSDPPLTSRAADAVPSPLEGAFRRG